MPETTVAPESPPADRVDRSSSALRITPTLSPRGLSILLCVMCLIPVITIFQLWRILPPVYEGELEAAVSARNLPDAEFYELPFEERPAVPTGQLLIRNLSDQDWTHLNIQINRHYQIYDTVPIAAGQTREFDLDRFVSRTGARFQLRYNPLEFVRIYARRPTRDRATFEFDFKENGYPPLETGKPAGGDAQ